MVSPGQEGQDFPTADSVFTLQLFVRRETVMALAIS